MRASAERVLLALAVLCMAGAAIGYFVQREPKPETTAPQETARQESPAQEAQDEEPRRYPLPAGPRRFP
jgi:Na+-transporting methylmalonyl-CoA/oxaloacetate decarboxylase gamma subunit